MLTLEQDRSLSAYELAPTRARRVLEVAVRRRACVSLMPRNDMDLTLNGVIASATPESLWIALDGPQVGTEVGLESVCCECVVDLDRDRYLFETNILAAVEDDEGRRLEVARPDGLQVLQRRRFWRTPVCDPAEVRLVRTDSDGNQPWSGTAALLNVSPAGLACLAPRDDTDATAIGDLLTVAFELPGAGEPFALEGILRSKTPASSESRIVLGLEFCLQGNGEQFHRLRTALTPYA